jgi:hypothetical protein
MCTMRKIGTGTRSTGIITTIMDITQSGVLATGHAMDTMSNIGIDMTLVDRGENNSNNKGNNDIGRGVNIMIKVVT